MKLLIVTGMSGSGKSQVLNALEDIGYYCIDNLPPKLLLNFAEFRSEMSDISGKIAITIDSRSQSMFLSIQSVFDSLKEREIEFSTLFLECDSNVLLKRYKESRRNHPLMKSVSDKLETAIESEKKILSSIRMNCDYLIDTSMLSTSQLKSNILDLFGEGKTDEMKVQFVSFGFKYGILVDADVVFDLRCLPNPYYVEGLREKTGETQEVRDFVMSHDKAQGLMGQIKSYLDYSIPLYINEGKSQLVVGVGCTGGKHRSVTFAHLLDQHYKKVEFQANSSHRDIHRK